MSLFFNRNLYQGTGKRPTGFNRYRDLIERNYKKLLKANLLTLLFLLPFAAGVLLAILSTSVLVLLPACIIGGAIAGPALSCMYDAVFRSLREAPGSFMDNYKHAWKQNWRQSFILKFFWKTAGVSALQLVYWAVLILFLPVSVILLPITGIWFILYSAGFLLYDTINEVFHLEEQIAESYPEQVPFYEDDETWLKRKQEEPRETNC